ncbi:PaaX family transcriptional regulator C-terminal domain-containing protein [Blastococcus brunescens]|uniref:PaaX family transcriptional regulator C-terminal domain-containing protein n=1 Tax=Blastococcus brunescens TaxID=1564165 RepID=A0ABZ1B6T1_9ACTN|nr:PaaX family transcriptional regulator C-terminal domain-containing protein [Blastococcus sp. BMG 8361]WRL66522.1 PaaX family transcriptional regulator C-terminal domain-containing protein [Blastococcus sp. BMG 8361]
MTVVEEATGSVAGAAGPLQPRQLIVTLYGLYAREHHSWLSIASVVRLMADLGVEEPAVRSSISRLKRRGLLDSRRVDGVAGYALTEVAQEILADGDARIFGRRRADEADGWLLVVFSVPESERDRRHQLRSQLTRLGFGTVAPGVWVAPGHLADEAAEVLGRRGLAGYVEFFRGAHLALGEARDTVARWWDLDHLHARYAEFLDRQEPVRERLAAGDGAEPEQAFADYVRLLTDWRRLPYADPGLPLHLLPADWNGARAADLFVDLQGRLADPAHDHARRLIDP